MTDRHCNSCCCYVFGVIFISLAVCLILFAASFLVAYDKPSSTVALPPDLKIERKYLINLIRKKVFAQAGIISYKTSLWMKNEKYQRSNWSTLDKKQYLVIPEKSNCTHAKQVCAKLGGTLPSITNKQLNNHIIGESIKMGLSSVRVGEMSVDKNREFIWADGSDTRHFKDWLPGKPNNNEITKWSIELRMGWWNDIACDDPKHLFICIGEGKVCDGLEWKKIDHGRCVWSAEYKQTGTKAKQTCQDLGGHLPRRSEESVAMVEAGRSAYLSVQKIDHIWYWMKDDETQEVISVQSDRWRKGEPNNKGRSGRAENCLKMSTISGWKGTVCSPDAPPVGFVCERQNHK